VLRNKADAALLTCTEASFLSKARLDRAQRFMVSLPLDESPRDSQ